MWRGPLLLLMAAGLVDASGCTTELSSDRHDAGRASDVGGGTDAVVLADAHLGLDAFSPVDAFVLAPDVFTPPPDAFVLPIDAYEPMPTIDTSTWIVMNSPSDIGSWSETATITQLALYPDGVRIDFTKRDGAGSWPDVPFVTPGEDLQYTLWIVIRIGGQWYTSGCLQYWRGLDRMGGPPSMYAANWYYDPGRWGAMSAHQPAVGEWVGFFVAAGNERNVTDHSATMVLERSNIVVVPFPTDAGATFTF
jgi:hypothetical protein